MGDISFPNIPQNIRVPLFYADIDPSNANTGQQTLRALIIGQMIAGSPGVADQGVTCQGVDATKLLAGQGSMLALMAAAYRKRDLFGEVWLLPLADDPPSTAAAGSINFTSVATATGVLSLYIGGQVVSLVVTPTMTAAQLATALVAQMETLPDLPVSAAVDATTTSKVDFTAKNKGLAGNDIDLQLNYGGTLAGGAGGDHRGDGRRCDESVGAADGVGQSRRSAVRFIAFPYTDSTSLGATQALPFAWNADGTITFDLSMTSEHVDAVEAVYAAHDPTKALPVSTTLT